MGGNVKMDIQGNRKAGAEGIDLAQDRETWLDLVYAVMNLRVPYNTGNLWSS
jgi:hypothetical protein